MKRLILLGVVVILYFVMTLTQGCVTTGSWHPEKRFECEVTSQLRAQTVWGSGHTASAMAILDWYQCMSSE